MLDKYKKEQPIVTEILTKSINHNKLVQAYLFYSNDINYVFDYAKEFSKEVITLNMNEDKESICRRIDDNIYSEFKIIEPISDVIKKEQLLTLQTELQTKPVEGNKIIYIIKGADKLNSSSANSILKFLEEPSENIIAILITDNISNVLPTIKSRCQIINFNRINFENQNDSYEILKNILQNELSNTDIEDFNKIVDDSINFAQSLEDKKYNIFIQIKKIFDVFKTKDDLNILLIILIYVYVDALYIKIGKSIKYMKTFEKIINNISENNTIDDIIRKIYVFQEVKFENSYNANVKMLIDKLIIELGEI